jgi:hypothetical protein
VLSTSDATGAVSSRSARSLPICAGQRSSSWWSLITWLKTHSAGSAAYAIKQFVPLQALVLEANQYSTQQGRRHPHPPAGSAGGGFPVRRRLSAAPASDAAVAYMWMSPTSSGRIRSLL